MDNKFKEKDLMKRCSRFGKFSLKCNFFKDISQRDGLNLVCKVRRIGDCYEKHERKIEYQNFCAIQNRAKINLYEKIKGKKIKL